MAVKLYQDYKTDREREKQIEEDKNAIDLGENVVIIYEKSNFASKIIGVLGFCIVMLIVGIGIISLLHLFFQ